MSSPTDNWDDWGDATSSQPSTENTQQSGDDWGDWGDSSEQAQPESSSSDWDDWDSGNQQADNQQSSNDDWNNWGSSPDQNQSGSNFIDDSQDVNQSWSSQPQDYQTQSPTEPPIQTHFSTKTIAIIVAVAILGIAFLLMGIDKFHITKKPADTNTNTTTSTVQQQQQDDANTKQNSNTQGNNTQSDDTQGNNVQENASVGSLNSATLVEIPSSASMTYSNDTLKANGKVTDKKKYVQGKQIVYCVEITIAVGSSSETVNYYCTSATFNQVGKGDILIVNYVQVDDSYISITNVEK